MSRIASLAALIAVSLTALLAAQTEDGDRLRIRVVPRYTSAPGALRVIAIVERDDRNRRLTVEVDSPGAYRSSERPLEGDHASRRHALTFTNLPVGTYEIRVRLMGVDTDLTAVRTFSVFAEDGRSSSVR